MIESAPQKDKQRESRICAYAAKCAAGFNCEAEGCSATNRLLAYEVADGSVIVRCSRHAGSATPLPGQWDEAERRREALRS